MEKVLSYVKIDMQGAFQLLKDPGRNSTRDNPGCKSSQTIHPLHFKYYKAFKCLMFKDKLYHSLL